MPKSVGLPEESFAPFGVAVVPNFMSPSTQNITCSMGMLAIGWPAPLVGFPGLGPGSNTLDAVETPAGTLVSTDASDAVVVVESLVVNVVNVDVDVDVLVVSALVVVSEVVVEVL